MKPIDQLTEEVIRLAIKMHRSLGPGFPESARRKALLPESARVGLQVDSEKPLKKVHKGTVAGDFAADLLPDGRLIVALKPVQVLTAAQEVQTVNYLAASGLDDALLINFGASSLPFKRKRRLPKSKQSRKSCPKLDEPAP